MMLYILTGLAALAAASVYLARKKPEYGRNSESPQRIIATPLAWVSSMLVIGGGLLYPISYAVSATDNADLQAYAGTINDAYRETAITTGKIQAGQAALPLGLGAIALGTAAWQQNTVTAQRWADLRNKVDWYNTLLSEKIAWSNNWFLRLWMAPLPAGLSPIAMAPAP